MNGGGSQSCAQEGSGEHTAGQVRSLAADSSDGERWDGGQGDPAAALSAVLLERGTSHNVTEGWAHPQSSETVPGPCGENQVLVPQRR